MIKGREVAVYLYACDLCERFFPLQKEQCKSNSSSQRNLRKASGKAWLLGFQSSHLRKVIHLLHGFVLVFVSHGLDKMHLSLCAVLLE